MDVSEFQTIYDDACGEERHYSCGKDIHMRVDEEDEHWIDLEGRAAVEIKLACASIGITPEELMSRAIEEYAANVMLGESLMDALELEHELRMKAKEAKK